MFFQKLKSIRCKHTSSFLNQHKIAIFDFNSIVKLNKTSIQLIVIDKVVKSLNIDDKQYLIKDEFKKLNLRNQIREISFEIINKKHIAKNDTLINHIFYENYVKYLYTLLDSSEYRNVNQNFFKIATQLKEIGYNYIIVSSNFNSFANSIIYNNLTRQNINLGHRCNIMTYDDIQLYSKRYSNNFIKNYYENKQNINIIVHSNEYHNIVNDVFYNIVNNILYDEKNKYSINQCIYFYNQNECSNNVVNVDCSSVKIENIDEILNKF